MAFYIGIAGQAQNGKDTLADYLFKRLNRPEWIRDAFASNVKKVFEETFGVDREFLEEWKVKIDTPPDFDMNIRKSLQFIGDGFRKIKSSIWIDLTFRDNVSKIISDVRYPNEFACIHQKKGLNILIARSDRINEDLNLSESLIKPYAQWALNNFKNNFTVIEDVLHSYNDYPINFNYFDVFIRNDGTLQDLNDLVDEYLIEFVNKKFYKGKKCLI
jgi:hypothetical protein